MTGMVFTRWLMGVPQLMLGALFCYLWAEFRQWEFYGLAVLFLGWGIISHSRTIKVWNITYIHDLKEKRRASSAAQ